MWYGILKRRIKTMKVKLTVGKKFTLNTQNFSSVSPSVTLEIVDGIDANKLFDAHANLELLADALLHDQIKSDAVTMATIKKLGFGEYFKQIDQEAMDEKVEKALSDLINVGDDMPF